MKSKKTPMRQCVGCMEMKPKSFLIRVVKSADGAVALDTTGKQSGRGAYLCKSAACFEKAVKAKKLQRAFECAISDSLLESLKEELNDIE